MPGPQNWHMNADWTCAECGAWVAAGARHEHFSESDPQADRGRCSCYKARVAGRQRIVTRDPQCLVHGDRERERWTISICPKCRAASFDPPTECEDCEKFGGGLVDIEVVPAPVLDGLREVTRALLASRVGGNHYKDRAGETLVKTEAFDALAAALTQAKGEARDP